MEFGTGFLEILASNLGWMSFGHLVQFGGQVLVHVFYLEDRLPNYRSEGPLRAFWSMGVQFVHPSALGIRPTRQRNEPFLLSALRIENADGLAPRWLRPFEWDTLDEECSTDLGCGSCSKQLVSEARVLAGAHGSCLQRNTSDNKHENELQP